MAEPDLYCDIVLFGHAVREMKQVGEQLQFVATSLGSALAGELGPAGLRDKAQEAAEAWAAGALKVGDEAVVVANNISADIATSTNNDLRAQITLLNAIAGEDVTCKVETPDGLQHGRLTPDGKLHRE